MSDEDPIGYKNPPKSFRFKSGQSGNPKGRPKKQKQFATNLMEELLQTIEIREGGKIKRARKFDVVIKQLIQKAMEGDIRTAKIILDTLSDPAMRQAFGINAWESRERTKTQQPEILEQLERLVRDRGSNYKLLENILGEEPGKWVLGILEEKDPEKAAILKERMSAKDPLNRVLATTP